jgi:hypothetical protein
MGEHGVVVHPSQLATALSAVAIGVGKGTFTPITMESVGQILRITGNDDEGDCGVATDTVPMLGMAPEKPDLAVSVNSIYLNSVLKSIGSQVEKQVVMNTVSHKNLPASLLGISIGSGYKEFGSASYIVSPLAPKVEAPPEPETAKPKKSKK